MFSYGSYYYIIIGLQIFCAVHSYRRGTLNRWIFLIVFLPVIGSIIYLYSEMSSRRRTFIKPQNFSRTSGAGNIKKLEEELRFTDTFANRMKLADAYLAAGQTQKAIDLYETSLTGAFAENEHALQQLIVAYFEEQRYADIIPLAKKLYKTPQFARSKAHLLYAMSLENLGDTEQAENEFKTMKGRYSNFEQRYQYGLFLTRAERYDDAAKVFTDMIVEEPHLSAVEKRSNRTWFANAKAELRKLSSLQKST